MRSDVRQRQGAAFGEMYAAGVFVRSVLHGVTAFAGMSGFDISDSNAEGF
jgi:hypothetical protein